MINIQRNFFIETILLETKVFKEKHLHNLPYKDYINISKNNDLSLIFLDIDRIDKLKKIYDDLKNLIKKKIRLFLYLYQKMQGNQKNLLIKSRKPALIILLL